MEFQKTVSFGRARQHLQAEFCDLKDKIGKVGVLVPDFVGPKDWPDLGDTKKF